MLTYDEAIKYIEESLQDNAYIWFRYLDYKLGWYLHGRDHHMCGTDYWGFRPIEEETAKRLWDEGLVGCMFEPPKHQHYEQYRQPDGTFENRQDYKQHSATSGESQ